MTKNLFDNPFYVILLFFIVTFLNIIFSVHFIPIILAGVVFTAFIYVYEKEYYYSLALTVVTFFVIESSQGLPLFSLSLLSFLIYIFIIPKLKQLFSLGELDLLLFVLIFYFIFLVLFSIIKGFSISVILKIFLNIFIDLVIVGVLF